MPNQTAQSIARQVKQLGDEAVEQITQRSGDAAGRAVEGGAASGQPPAAGQVFDAEQAKQEKLAQKRAQDKAQSEQQISAILRELEQEIEKHRQERKRQLEERQVQPLEETAVEEQPVQAPVSPQPKGLRVGIQARKRSSQSEMAGMRRSG